METIDEVIRDKAMEFVEKVVRAGRPFLLYLNPSRMHCITHLSPKYEKMRTPENGWTVEEAGMAQLDDIVGAVMQKLKDLGIDHNTIVVFSTDNGAENFTWPDGGQTPFAGGEGTVLEGGFRVPIYPPLASFSPAPPSIILSITASADCGNLASSGFGIFLDDLARHARPQEAVMNGEENQRLCCPRATRSPRPARWCRSPPGSPGRGRAGGPADREATRRSRARRTLASRPRSRVRLEANSSRRARRGLFRRAGSAFEERLLRPRDVPDAAERVDAVAVRLAGRVIPEERVEPVAPESPLPQAAHARQR